LIWLLEDEPTSGFANAEREAGYEFGWCELWPTGAYHRWFDGRWSEWENMGGATDFGITVASPGLNRLLLMHVGQERNIYYRE
jgi:hypothetical protein